MILVLTLVYVGLLLLATKLGWIRLTLWWKLSPAVWMVFLLVALFIPLQFWAPSGSLVVANYAVAIVPQVSGEVITVDAQANRQLKKGDLLFTIDPTPFQAAYDDAQASLSLAEIRLQQENALATKQVGTQLNLDRARANVAQAEARLARARFDLESTRVRAPSDGYVTNVRLRPGVRAATLPLQPAMTFMDTNTRFVGGFVFQNHLRLVEPGQKVELALKMYPGQILEGEVDYVVPARATGLEVLTGLPTADVALAHGPFAVRIKLVGNDSRFKPLSGATGSMVIYSGQGRFAHVIRMVELRLEAIFNYVLPM
jgi:RND family efflux transporter MFP subunit